MLRANFASLFLAFVIALFALAPLSAQPDFLRGDVDGDGCVNALFDAAYLLSFQFIPGSPGINCNDAADANGDGVVNGLVDGLYLLNWGFIAGATAIPAPGPFSCGPAPGGGIGCNIYVCAPCAAQPPDPNFLFFLATQPSAPTGPILLDVRLTSNQALAGFSFGVTHTPQVDDPINIAEGPALAALNGGSGPDSFLVKSIPGVGWTVGVLVNLLGNDTIPPSNDDTLIIAEYPCSGTGTALFDFSGAIGNPPVPTSAVRPGLIPINPTTQGTAASCGPPPPFSFVRGDMSGDGFLDATDAQLLEQFLFPGVLFGPPPEPLGCDLVPNESGDINDNEIETIADLLMFREFLDCGSISLPGPSSCGDDPDDETTGFQFIDPDYLVSAFSMSITGAVDSERDVTVSIRIKSPTTVKAVSLGLLLGSELSLANPPLTMDPSVSADFFGTLVEGDFVVVAAGSTTCATPMMPSSATLAPLATLHLKLAPFAIFPPVELVQEASVLGHIRRTTVVDEAFQDHQPFFMSGTADRFARGNANNFDAFVDIADPIYILGHLFPSPVSLPLDCRDAADANNDGLVDIADPVFVLAFLFTSGPVMPPPYPQCGFDQDIDAIDLQFFLDPSMPPCESPFCP
jgi:hypothetical protein